MCSTSSVTPTCRTLKTGGGGQGAEGKQKCQGRELLAYTDEYFSNELIVRTKNHLSCRHETIQFIEELPPMYTGLRITTYKPKPYPVSRRAFSSCNLLYHEVEQSLLYSIHIEATTARSFITLPRMSTLPCVSCRHCGFAYRGFKLVCPVEQPRTKLSKKHSFSPRWTVMQELGTSYRRGWGNCIHNFGARCFPPGS